MGGSRMLLSPWRRMREGRSQKNSLLFFFLLIHFSLCLRSLSNKHTCTQTHAHFLQTKSILLFQLSLSLFLFLLLFLPLSLSLSLLVSLTLSLFLSLSYVYFSHLSIYLFPFPHTATATLLLLLLCGKKDKCVSEKVKGEGKVKVRGKSSPNVFRKLLNSVAAYSNYSLFPPPLSLSLSLSLSLFPSLSFLCFILKLLFSLILHRLVFQFSLVCA